MDLFKRSFPATPFDLTHNYVTSPLPFLTPPRLAFLRLTLAFYTLFTNIFTLAWVSIKFGIGKSFFSFFTQLSYIGLCAYFCAAGLQTFLYAQGRRSSHARSSPSNEYGYVYTYPLQRWPRSLQFLHIWLTVTVTTYPFLVTIVYWAVLSSSSTFATAYSTWSNISVHAMNTPFALFEILCTNTPPAPWITLPGGILILALYLGVAYITKASQGFYVYNFLNPQTQHAVLAAWIIGIALAYCVIFSLVRGIVIVRVWVFARGVRGAFRQRAESGGMEGEKSEAEGVDDWVEVDSGRWNRRQR